MFTTYKHLLACMCNKQSSSGPMEAIRYVENSSHLNVNSYANVIPHATHIVGITQTCLSASAKLLAITKTYYQHSRGNSRFTILIL